MLDLQHIEAGRRLAGSMNEGPYPRVFAGATICRRCGKPTAVPTDDGFICVDCYIVANARRLELDEDVLCVSSQDLGDIQEVRT